MAWNEPGGNNSGGKRNPWGNRPGQGPPDLDEVVRNLQRRLSGLFRGGRGSGGAMSSGTGGGFSGGSIAVVLLAIWSFTGFYTVDAAERGVVMRFGKYVSETEPGLRWHIPWPVESKQIVNVASIDSFSDQTSMLTADENLVEINLAVQFRRGNSKDYAFSVRDPEATLKEVSESAIREVVGRSSLDAVLATGRQKIADETEKLIQKTLDKYSTGITVTTVNLQGVKVPDEVAPRQQDAIRAREDKERATLEAQTFANDIGPKAEGDAKAEVERAKAYSAQIVSKATGEAERFRKLLVEFQQAPGVTRERLYLETIEAVLSSTKKVVVDNKGSGNLIYLPLDKLVEQGVRADRPRQSSEMSVTRSPDFETSEPAGDRARGAR
jgi:membrane protease subunit HflK